MRSVDIRIVTTATEAPQRHGVSVVTALGAARIQKLDSVGVVVVSEPHHVSHTRKGKLSVRDRIHSLT